jgi:hypothetical protein
MKKAVLIFISITLFLLVGFFIVGRFFPGEENIAPIPAGSEQDDVSQNVEDTRPPKQRKTLPPEFQNDKDRDGLSEDQEALYGTDNLESDTDGDGISDGDEVLRWKTDPLSADTDGDGFADLIEILGGYNPAGDGALE